MGLSKVDVKAAMDMKQEGHTLQQIGDRFGVSRERVRQMLDTYSFIPHLLTRRQVEKLLKVSCHTLSDREKKGVLHPIRKGNSFYFYRMEDISEIRELVTKRCIGCGMVIPRLNTWCHGCLLEHKRFVNRETSKKHYAKYGKRKNES